MPYIVHLNAEIKRLAKEAGFDLAGVSGVADTPEQQFFRTWISQGSAAR